MIAASRELKIAGVDQDGLLIKDSISVSDDLNARNTCSFSLFDEAGAYVPEVGAVVEFKAGSKLLFSGSIDDTEEGLTRGSPPMQVRVACVDYNQIADRRLVAEVFENKTLGYIVKFIVDKYLAVDGVTYSHVQDGQVITKAVFNYKPASSCFDELAELIGYAWNIDYAKDLHFFARETYTAPFSLTDTSTNYRNLKVKKTRSEYRNAQFIRAGHDLTDTLIERFKGDGETTTFTLAFPVGEQPSYIEVNDVAKTIGIQGVDTGKNWYWSKESNQISQDSNGTKLTASDALEVAYKGLFPIIVKSQDDQEVAVRTATEGGSGMYEAIDDDQSIELAGLAIQKADGLLRKFGRIPKVVEFETDSFICASADELASGQLITIKNTAHGLDGSYLIDRITIRLVDGYPVYSVRCLDGESIGGWVDFFKKLSVAGRKFVIRENEVLLLLQRASDVVAIVDSLTTVMQEPQLLLIESGEIGFSEISP